MRTLLLVVVLCVGCTQSPPAPDLTDAQSTDTSTDTSSDAGMDLDANIPPDSASDVGSDMEDIGVDMRMPLPELVVNSVEDNETCNAMVCTLRGATILAASEFQVDNIPRRIVFDLPPNADINLLTPIVLTETMEIVGPPRDVNSVDLVFPTDLASPAFTITGDDITIANLGFRGQPTNADGLHVQGQQTTIDNVVVIGFQTGVSVDGPRARILNSRVGDFGTPNVTGMRLTSNADDVSVIDSTIANSEIDGVTIEVSEDLNEPTRVALFERTWFDQNGNHGLHSERGHIHVVDSVFSGNGVDSIGPVSGALNIRMPVVGNEVPSEAEAIVIRGSRFGVDVNGTDAPNIGNNVDVFGAIEVVVGGDRQTDDCTSPCNLVSGGQFGMRFAELKRLTVQGNFIGTNRSGTEPRPVTRALVISSVQNNTQVLVGTDIDRDRPPATCVGKCNVIGTSDDQYMVDVNIVENIVIRGNFFGVSQDAVTPLPSTYDTLSLDRVTDATIDANLLGPSPNSGLTVVSDINIGGTISDNLIGTNAAQGCPVARATNGVHLQAGVTASWVLTNNVVGCATGNGALISSDGGTTLDGNLIGVNDAGEAIGSGQRGVYVAGSDVTIRNNQISNNNLEGIIVRGTGSRPPPDNVTIENNEFGNFVLGTGGNTSTGGHGAVKLRFALTNITISGNQVSSDHTYGFFLDDVSMSHVFDNEIAATTPIAFAVSGTLQNPEDGTSDYDMGPNTLLNSPTIDNVVGALSGTVNVHDTEIKLYEVVGGVQQPLAAYACSTNANTYVCSGANVANNNIRVVQEADAVRLDLTGFSTIDLYQFTVDGIVIDRSLMLPVLNLFDIAEQLSKQSDAHPFLVNHDCEVGSSACSLYVVGASGVQVTEQSALISPPFDVGPITSASRQRN